MNNNGNYFDKNLFGEQWIIIESLFRKKINDHKLFCYLNYSEKFSSKQKHLTYTHLYTRVSNILF